MEEEGGIGGSGFTRVIENAAKNPNTIGYERGNASAVEMLIVQSLVNIGMLYMAFCRTFLCSGSH